MDTLTVKLYGEHNYAISTHYRLNSLTDNYLGNLSFKEIFFEENKDVVNVLKPVFHPYLWS